MIPSLVAAQSGGGSATVPVIVLILALVGFAVAYFVVGPGKRSGPRRHADIPLAMRPYHSDEELETTGMERAMAWGVALAVFASLFLPLYWLIEPARINNAVEDFYQHDVATGRAEYQNACASCHGSELQGGSTPHPDPDVDVPWPVPRLDNIVARYQDSEIVTDVREFIELTLVHGRPGTPMPPFSVANGGTYSDNQLNQIIAYILSVQTGELPEGQALQGRSGGEMFAANCARCHGPQGEGAVGPQLLNVFERYGWSGDDDETLAVARDAVEQVIRDGRLVPGIAPMPAFDQTLDDASIAAVIDHLESIQQTGGPRFGQVGGDPVPAEDADEDADDDVEDDA